MFRHSAMKNISPLYLDHKMTTNQESGMFPTVFICYDWLTNVHFYGHLSGEISTDQEKLWKDQWSLRPEIVTQKYGVCFRWHLLDFAGEFIRVGVSTGGKKAFKLPDAFKDHPAVHLLVHRFSQTGSY